MDNYTSNKTWQSLVSTPDTHLLDQFEFEAHYHKYTPKDGMYTGMFGRKCHTFKIQIYNMYSGYKHLISCCYLTNVVTIMHIEEGGSEVKHWQYRKVGDEAGRASRLGHWFMKKLESDHNSDELIRLFPKLVLHCFGDKPDLQLLNTLWTNHKVEAL